MIKISTKSVILPINLKTYLYSFPRYEWNIHVNPYALELVFQIDKSLVFSLMRVLRNLIHYRGPIIGGPKTEKPQKIGMQSENRT